MVKRTSSIAMFGKEVLVDICMISFDIGKYIMQTMVLV